jgi:predicted nucleic acid-binding protein
LVTVFADTSAMYATLDRMDADHALAIRGRDLVVSERLVTHGYVIAETLALVRRRLGADAAVRVIDEFLPTLDVIDVDGDLFTEAVRAYRAVVAGGASFVDRLSFAFMRRHGLTRAWALDRDFAMAGFELVA